MRNPHRALDVLDRHFAPQLLHPSLGKTMSELWRQLDRAAHPMQAVERTWSFDPSR